MDWDLLRTIVLGVFGVVTAVASGLAGLLVGANRTLRDSITDLRGRRDDLEKERAEDKAEIARLTSENELLHQMVTGRVDWALVTNLLTEHHKQARAWWAEMKRLLTKILSALGEVKK